MLNYHEKNEVKRSNHSEDISCKRIKQSDFQRKFWVNILKTETVKLLEITESSCCFYEYTHPYVTYPYANKIRFL